MYLYNIFFDIFFIYLIITILKKFNFTALKIPTISIINLDECFEQLFSQTLIFIRSPFERFFRDIYAKQCTKNSRYHLLSLLLQVSAIPLDDIIIKIGKKRKRKETRVERVFPYLIAFSSSLTLSIFTRKVFIYNVTHDAFNPIKTALTRPVNY